MSALLHQKLYLTFWLVFFWRLAPFLLQNTTRLNFSLPKFLDWLKEMQNQVCLSKKIKLEEFEEVDWGFGVRQQLLSIVLQLFFTDLGLSSTLGHVQKHVLQW